MSPVAVLGVISDTHIPDRGNVALHPQVLPIFSSAGVTHILHCGDITQPSVLQELERLAPVSAVQGNRDWIFGNDLPRTRTLEFGDVRLGLVHGHGNLGEYLFDKLQMAIEGYQLRRYQQRIAPLFDDVQVIVYGHTHVATIQWAGKTLYFNPGAAGAPGLMSGTRSIGIVRIYPQQGIAPEIILLG